MKKSIISFTVLLISCCSIAQKLYNGIPVIRASAFKAQYFIGKQKIRYNWTISPEIEGDGIFVNSVSKKTTLTFITNLDSIYFLLTPNKSNSFYVKVNDTTYALTVVKFSKIQSEHLVFNQKKKDSGLRFWYEDNKNNTYLNDLLAMYPLNELIRNSKTDTERALQILHWVNKQWAHNGNNESAKSDAISILQEAKQGKLFRCVEYAIVTKACLNAIGLRARVLNLKTKNAETAQLGAGHVLAEVYLNDLKKWALLDGQFDAMPVLNDVPLNAIEFQKAITGNSNKLKIITSSNLDKDYYVDWIYPYLYYFDSYFDNREGMKSIKQKNKGKTGLMFVPSGAKEPHVFQIKNKIENCLYTNSVKDFYVAPNL